tara:strand:- start:248 stop:565 length:318 start_codon:yes stop_codon:yes gene_type:complete
MNIQQKIIKKLTDDFSPIHLEVINESSNHNVPEGSESHFKVTLVSNSFDNLSLIRRHKSVNKSLSGEIRESIHALALHTLTPDEWFERNGSVPESPKCLGGSKNK